MVLDMAMSHEDVLFIYLHIAGQTQIFVPG